MSTLLRIVYFLPLHVSFTTDDKTRLAQYLYVCMFGCLFIMLVKGFLSGFHKKTGGLKSLKLFFNILYTQYRTLLAP